MKNIPQNDNLSSSVHLTKRMNLALVGWFLWALLPLPLVWSAFYAFKAFWVAIILYAGVVCCMPVLFVYFRKLDYAKPSFAVKYSHWLLLEIVAFILLTWFAMEGGWQFYKKSMLDWDKFPTTASSIGIQMDILFVLLVIYFVLLNPVVEECFWRGLVYEQFKKAFPRWLAVSLSALLFGGWHWVIIQYFFLPEWQILLTALVCIGGVLFAILYDRSKSLVPGILVHGLGADLAIMAILWEMLSSH